MPLLGKLLRRFRAGEGRSPLAGPEYAGAETIDVTSHAFTNGAAIPQKHAGKGVGTHSTALSQHCLCGQRVPKRLSQRTHDCPHCGLHADRDVTSAMLAACVDVADPDDPSTARVDYRLAHALRAWLASQQEWEGSVNRYQPPATPVAGSDRTGSRHPVASAEQAALGPPPNRPGSEPERRGTSRKRQSPKLFSAA